MEQSPTTNTSLYSWEKWLTCRLRGVFCSHAQYVSKYPTWSSQWNSLSLKSRVERSSMSTLYYIFHFSFSCLLYPWKIERTSDLETTLDVKSSRVPQRKLSIIYNRRVKDKAWRLQSGKPTQENQQALQLYSEAAIVEECGILQCAKTFPRRCGHIKGMNNDSFLNCKHSSKLPQESKSRFAKKSFLHALLLRDSVCIKCHQFAL